MSLLRMPNINREQALTHILESIALEETALAAFIDAEAKKTQVVIEKISKTEQYQMPTHEQIIAFQRSVDSTIQTVIKMQMLLQFKLRAVLDANSIPTPAELPPPPSASREEPVCPEQAQNIKKDTVIPQTEFSSQQQMSLPPDYFILQQEGGLVLPEIETYHHECCLAGQGQGRITNGSDSFFGGSASIPDVLISANRGIFEHSLLSYQVIRKGVIERLKVTAKTLKIQCRQPFNPQPSPESPNMAIITGKCLIEKHIPAEPTATDRGSFVLSVWDGGIGDPGTDKFRMVITADNKPLILNHDSGVVNVIGNLTVETNDSN